MTIFFLFLCYFFFGDKMKKVILLLILFLGISFFIFSSFSEEAKEVSKYQENRGIFISYIELSNYLKGKDEKSAKREIEMMISNVKNLGFTMVFLQVRSFSDAIYPSNIYPWSSIISEREGEKIDYDVLELFLKVCKKCHISLFAWINPYRIRSDEDVTDISSKNPASSYLESDSVYISDGIFYNPAKEEVKELIVSGVLELVENYDIDGVMFDDYFYPTTSEEIDQEEFLEYQEENPDASLSSFRLQQVSDLIQRVYDVCHSHQVLFAVSPDGNIENNYQKHYADVKLWGDSEGYVDFLMPQIYYGFYNEAKDFYSALGEWEKLATKVSLLPVLAFYKVGAVDNFAKSGKEEWMQSDDIIMREIVLSRNLKQYYGFSLFRYDYLFNQELETSTTMMEVKNMKKVLK